MTRPFLERRSRRRPVSVPARCGSAGGLRGDGLHDGCEMSDLTAEGCCVRNAGIALLVGMRVVIRAREFESLTGIVRWLSGEFCGVEFDRPLHRAVVDHLVHLHATFTPERHAVG
ncbi:MAG: PilZ protein [Novosphingobium lindaniclasticum]|uniref:PilZ domain-containing protein n=1 Tax=Novosphingobium lindaniclasticum TaxID=1329895 RepID=UPI00240A5588|nr:PilZ domain-containing protein [Novosphingobium lindaniclasticum]MDF2637379.1 PilZ protein [Novosphingobium lindaniclasticum]